MELGRVRKKRAIRLRNCIHEKTKRRQKKRIAL